MVPKYQCSYSRITISDGIGDWNGEVVEEDDMIDFSIALHDEFRPFVHSSDTVQRWWYMRCGPSRRKGALYGTRRGSYGVPLRHTPHTIRSTFAANSTIALKPA